MQKTPLSGLSGFHWLVPGLLGGTSQPGLTGDLNGDLAALQHLGVKLLVSLTAEWEPDGMMLAEYGIRSLYVPIADFSPPTPEQANSTCRRVETSLASGETVIFHCRAGKGRTGTMLAAMMIWEGRSSQEAIALTRARFGGWIETDSQLQFLKEFESFIAINMEK